MSGRSGVVEPVSRHLYDQLLVFALGPFKEDSDLSEVYYSTLIQHVLDVLDILLHSHISCLLRVFERLKHRF
jgi:hypothetical protein